MPGETEAVRILFRCPQSEGCVKPPLALSRAFAFFAFFAPFAVASVFPSVAAGWTRAAILVNAARMNRLPAFFCAAFFLATSAVISSAADAIPVTGADGKPLNLGFEDGSLRDWTATGDAFTGQPVKG